MTQPTRRQNWSTQKVKYVAALKSGDAITSEDINESDEYPVYGGNGIRGYTSRYNCNGDHPLIGRQGALCGNINFASGKFWASEHAVVVYPKNNHHARWLGLLLQSMDLNQYSQSAAQPGISVEIIENLTIPVPPRDEQEIISAHLTKETSRLDRLIAEKERMLALLEEKRAALISRVVTQGLNPDAPLKDSGQDWLGIIPEHWDVPQLRFVCKELQIGPFGTQLHAEEYVDNGVPLINPAHLKGNKITPDYGISVDEITAERLAIHRLEEGDIVFGRRGELGRCAVVQPDQAGWLCGTGSLRARCNKILVNPSYVALVFNSSSAATRLTLESVGSTMDNLNTEMLGHFCIPLPPLTEQNEIVGAVETDQRRINTLRDSLQLSIVLAKERRSAIITTAVTGQIFLEDMTA